MEKIPYGRAIPLQPALLEEGRETLRTAIAPLSRRTHRQQVVGIIGIGASYCATLAAEYLFRSLGVRSIAIDAGQLYAGDSPRSGRRLHRDLRLWPKRRDRRSLTQSTRRPGHIAHRCHRRAAR